MHPDAHTDLDSIFAIGKGAFKAFPAAEDAALKAAAAKVRADRDALLNPEEDNEDDEAPDDDGDDDEEEAEDDGDFGWDLGTFLQVPY